MNRTSRLDASTLRMRACARRRTSGAILVAGLLGSVVFPWSARAHTICDRSCGATDAQCLAAVAACNVRIDAYDIYMDQMAAGQTKHALPDVYQDILRPQYQTNFGAYQFGFSDRQPAHNATTDCFATFFNSQAYVDAVANAAANPEWKWLLHEVTHAEQCSALGGRDAYANRWWNELTAAAAAAGRTINFAVSPQTLAGQIGALFFSVHDRMPMEIAADAKAALVEPRLRACCIAASERPIRPLKLGAIADTADPPGCAESTCRYLLTFTTQNGDPPFKTKWTIRNPGEPGPVALPDDLETDSRVLWTPKRDKTKAQVVTDTFGTTYKWTYQIQVEVGQEDPELTPGIASRSITLSARTATFAPLDGGKLEDPSLPTAPPLPPPPQ